MKRKVIFSAMLFLIIGLASICKAQPWDYNAAYPTAAGGPNPNGVWTYGYFIGNLGGGAPYVLAPAADGHPNPDPNSDTPINVFWGTDAGGHFAKNPWPIDLSAPTWPCGMFFKANSTTLMTPASVVTNKVAAAFTAPQKGNYTINAIFESGVMDDWDTEVGVVVDYVWVYTDVVTSFLDVSSFDAVVALNEGQSIYFGLNNINGEGPSGYTNGGFHIITFNAVLDVSAYDPGVFATYDPNNYPIDGSINQPADPNNHTPRFFIPLVPPEPNEPNLPAVTSWDYTAEFPFAPGLGNPNGVWSYGYYVGTLGGAPYELYPAYYGPYAPMEGGPLNSFFANPANADGDGHMGYNPWSDTARPTWPDGMYWKGSRCYLMTPSSTYAKKVAALFTAPYAGVYQVDAYFESGVMNGYATDVAVFLNDGVISYNRIFGFQSGPENISEFSGVFDLAEGDTLGFGLNNVPGAGAYNGGYHIIDFNATMAITDPSNLPEPLPSELLLWLKADTGITTSGNIVTAWADQSGNGLNASLYAGDPTLETGTFRTGDKPVVRFDGHDSLLLYDNTPPEEDPNALPDNPLGLSSFSIYVVGKIATNSTGSSFIANSGTYSGSGWEVGISASQENKVALTTAQAELRWIDSLTVDRYYLIVCTVSHAYERKLYINGTLVARDNGGVSYDKTAAIAMIGDLLVGDIAEIRIYQGVDETVLNNTQNLLLDQYGISFNCADQAVYFAMDFNNDCYVNLEDFAKFVQEWLKCNDPKNESCLDIP